MSWLRWYAKNDFPQTEKYLKKLHTKKFQDLLMQCAEKGIEALKAATPKDTGYTAESWYADVVVSETRGTIYWKNSHYETSGKTGVAYPIAILIDIGHGTGTGGYVKPMNYIEPTMEPIIREINEAIIKEVRS